MVANSEDSSAHLILVSFKKMCVSIFLQDEFSATSSLINEIHVQAIRNPHKQSIGQQCRSNQHICFAVGVWLLLEVRPWGKVLHPET